MTQQEIEALKGRLDDSYMDIMGASLHCDLVDALERLAILEAAVAWHGFDEVPEFTGMIDLRMDNNAVMTNVPILQISDFDVDKFKQQGFTGWRYPVGDLG